METVQKVDKESTSPRFVTLYPVMLQKERKMKEIDVAVLTREIPEHGLQIGDIGIIVHSYSDGEAYEVEFVTAEGKTVAILTLSGEDIRSMTEREILLARNLADSEVRLRI